MSDGAHSLRKHPINLGLGARAVPQNEFTGDLAWYDEYVARNAADGREARLVMLSDFTESWNSWEMHPEGDEVVVCVSGSMVLVQEAPGGVERRITLGSGDYAINPAGTWHTADVNEAASAVFITAGVGTQHRPR